MDTNETFCLPSVHLNDIPSVFFSAFHWLIAVLSWFYRISSKRVELMRTHSSSNSIMAP